MGGWRCRPPSDTEYSADRLSEDGPVPKNQPVGVLNKPGGRYGRFEPSPLISSKASSHKVTN